MIRLKFVQCGIEWTTIVNIETRYRCALQHDTRNIEAVKPVIRVVYVLPPLAVATPHATTSCHCPWHTSAKLGIDVVGSQYLILRLPVEFRASTPLPGETDARLTTRATR